MIMIQTHSTWSNLTHCSCRRPLLYFDNVIIINNCVHISVSLSPVLKPKMTGETPDVRSDKRKPNMAAIAAMAASSAFKFQKEKLYMCSLGAEIYIFKKKKSGPFLGIFHCAFFSRKNS